MYAKALYELAEEASIEEKVLDELTEVVRILKSEPDYIRLADAYTLPAKQRAALLGEAFGGQIEEILLNTMKLLAEKNALSVLPECEKAYRSLYYDRHRITTAAITSAVPLSEDQKARLLAALEKKSGKRVLASYTTDGSVRGGIRIEMDGASYDNTVSTKLMRLERLLSNRA
ncbi:MAG: ATP synthase F1 subunit delta [Clostridiales bacterium]|nr:ATP synthase F1 subunit delta [Clostridiales bacterium]